MERKHFLIDGIDRLGKSTLVENIQQELGYHLVVHYDKPKRLKFIEENRKNHDPLYWYQYECNLHMFGLIQDAKYTPIIFDRTHLGEMVYAPTYRKYDGDYVFNMEQEVDTSNCKLVLLTTSNFDMLTDDGESFNWDNKAEEQRMFQAAFIQSTIQDKVMIDVHNGQGQYKDPQAILAEALKKS